MSACEKCCNALDYDHMIKRKSCSSELMAFTKKAVLKSLSPCEAVGQSVVVSAASWADESVKLMETHNGQ